MRQVKLCAFFDGRFAVLSSKKTSMTEGALFEKNIRSASSGHVTRLGNARRLERFCVLSSVRLCRGLIAG